MSGGTRSLDIGCGLNPKNPFQANEVYGVDIREEVGRGIVKADLTVEPIPFRNDFFDCVTAYDFIEHVPRIIYIPQRRFPFVELMNEIHRVLKPGGLFLSFTPAFPKAPAWRDPTHVNIITEETFPMYFCEPQLAASIYGFSGVFHLENQFWHENQMHLVSVMKKM